MILAALTSMMLLVGPGPDLSYRVVSPQITYSCSFDTPLATISFVNGDAERSLYTDTSGTPGSLGASPPMLTAPGATGRYVLVLEGTEDVPVVINGLGMTVVVPVGLCEGNGPAPEFTSAPPIGQSSPVNDTRTQTKETAAEDSTQESAEQDPETSEAESVQEITPNRANTVVGASSGSVLMRDSEIRYACGSGRYRF